MSMWSLNIEEGFQAMKSFIPLALLALSPGVVSASPSSEVCEIWFDSDFGTLRTVSVADDRCRASIPIEGLTKGLHYVNIRMADCGAGPGALFRSMFFIDPVDNSADMALSCEMWFDTDPTMVWTVPVKDGFCRSALSTEGLNPGLHFINMRSVMTDGGYGQLLRHPFFITEPFTKSEVSGCLVWIDEDAENATYHPCFENSESMAVSVDIGGLASGLHFVTMLPFDNLGRIGNVRRSVFYLSGSECPSVGGYEYWFDDDRDLAVSVGPSPAPLHLSLDISNLTVGQHELSIRACNDEGEWGNTRIIEFVIPQTLDSAEWDALLRLHARLVSQGWKTPWDVSRGPGAIHEFQGLKSNDGHITEITVANANVEGTLPTEPLEFPYLRKLDLSFNEMEGNAGIYASMNERFVSLNLSHNRISEVTPPLPETITHVDLSHQDIDGCAHIDLTNPDGGSLRASLPSMFTYNVDSRTYGLPSFILAECTPDDFSLGNIDGFGMSLSFDDGSFDITSVFEQNVYSKPIGHELSMMRLDEDGLFDGTSMRARLNFVIGYANFSGRLTGSDLHAIILYIYGRYPERPFNFTAADTYADQRLTVQDVIRTVNMLLSSEMEPSEDVRKKMPGNEIAPEVRIWAHDNVVWMESESPVSALRLSMNPGLIWKLADFGMDVVETETSVVAYSLSGLSIPAGRHIIAESDIDVRLKFAEASGEYAEELSVSLGGSSSSVEDPEAEQRDGCIFAPDGTRLHKIRKGINIIKRGDRVSKAIYSK